MDWGDEGLGVLEFWIGGLYVKGILVFWVIERLGHNCGDC